MAQYARVGEVETWYDDFGSGEPLLLMHGGHTDARFFEHNVGALADHFHVFTPERRGHGHTADTEGPFSYDLMADDTAAFLGTVIGGSAHLVGHSDGAVVAMLVALRRPELVRDLVLISGGYNIEGLIGGSEDFDVDELVEFAGDAYAEVSPDGIEHFRVVAQKTFEMAAHEPSLAQDDLAGISSRTLVMFGDDDLMTLEHVVSMYEGIPEAELAIVPGTSHFLLQEKPELCNRIVLDFLAGARVPTVAPVRRAQQTQ